MEELTEIECEMEKDTENFRNEKSPFTNCVAVKRKKLENRNSSKKIYWKYAIWFFS